VIEAWMSRLSRWVSWCALALALAPAAAAQEGVQGTWWSELEDMPPGFHTIEVDSIYRVSGFTRDDILREMHRKGPGVDNLGVRLGLHLSQWRYSYQYTYGGGNGRCRLTEAQVLLRSVIVLPRWTNVSTAPPLVARGWRPFVQALRAHEEGHRSRALAQGATLWTALLGLEASDCSALEDRVRETADTVLAEGQAQQVRYDEETGHGAAQGATWPE